ncbi:MAG: 5'-nucleotidase, lipoprotein e(P4) family [Sphingosinicella sp.]|uniref:5'-nucleotidase, lipoprotein e(P4) family n=1 Tax=Sphingosinicella sp. TaxID=1917971 RepID=UPI004037CD06
MRLAPFAVVLLALGACASAQAPRPAPANDAIVLRELPPTPPPAMQWLYGSGEGGAASIQAWHAFRDYVVAAVRDRPRDSVVLAADATLDAPRFLPCGDRPLAVILDADETAIQNLGYEFDEAIARSGYDQARWNRWERTGADAVLPMPGAVTALRAVREAGVTVIFNSNRQSANAEFTRRAIEGAGLGPARHRETLWLQGDVAPGSAKDPRRATVSQRYCVIAMAGDQLGDFSDLFNVRTLSVPERRRAATSGRFAQMWGNGWFMLSTPVYGPSIRGDFDDVFPRDRRWTDPGAE